MSDLRELKFCGENQKKVGDRLLILASGLHIIEVYQEIIRTV